MQDLFQNLTFEMVNTESSEINDTVLNAHTF
jgi:hypothetical protein